MSKYAFILGRNPALSVAEIISVFKRDDISFQIVDSSDEVLLIKTDKTLDSKLILNGLGGTIKIGQIISSLDLDKSEAQIYQIFSAENLFLNLFAKRKGKIHFGISLYLLDKESNLRKNYRQLLENISSTIKKQLQQSGQSGGFLRIKDRFLSSVSVDKNDLLTKGAEIILLISKDRLYIAKTLSVQEYESYSSRDYGRPVRDTRSGMLPPKLAKIMLNLSLKKKRDTILDPFCGSGTIITEAALMGFTHILGSDIKNEAVKATLTNLNWLKNQYSHQSSDLQVKVFPSDINDISSKIAPHSTDAIITEPYLGPPFTRTPDEREIISTLNQLASLYRNSFIQYSKIIKSNGRVVIIFPAFRLKGQLRLIDILTELSGLGFYKVDILPPDQIQKYTSFLSGRKTPIYGRGDEFIAREILIFDYLK